MEKPVRSAGNGQARWWERPGSPGSWYRFGGGRPARGRATPDVRATGQAGPHRQGSEAFERAATLPIKVSSPTARAADRASRGSRRAAPAGRLDDQLAQHRFGGAARQHQHDAAMHRRPVRSMVDESAFEQAGRYAAAARTRCTNAAGSGAAPATHSSAPTRWRCGRCRPACCGAPVDQWASLAPAGASSSGRMGRPRDQPLIADGERTCGHEVLGANLRFPAFPLRDGCIG